MAAFATASVGFVLLFALVILVLAVAPGGSAVAAAGAAGAAASRLLIWEMDGLLVAFPVMAYGFTAHPYYLGIYQMMPAPNVKRMNRVTDMVSLQTRSSNAESMAADCGLNVLSAPSMLAQAVLSSSIAGRPIAGQALWLRLR